MASRSVTGRLRQCSTQEESGSPRRRFWATFAIRSMGSTVQQPAARPDGAASGDGGGALDRATAGTHLGRLPAWPTIDV